ncbi:hypothetical protein PTMSG1_05099 [Pyrenophora teres f. maculata]|nr:hypothetical protein PTMSG1_05099 [Pyrenophora teres f. maculata]
MGLTLHLIAIFEHTVALGTGSLRARQTIILGFALASFIVVATAIPTPQGVLGEQLYYISVNRLKESWNNRGLITLKGYKCTANPFTLIYSYC